MSRLAKNEILTKKTFQLVHQIGLLSADIVLEDEPRSAAIAAADDDDELSPEPNDWRFVRFDYRKSRFFFFYVFERRILRRRSKSRRTKSHQSMHRHR